MENKITDLKKLSEALSILTGLNVHGTFNTSYPYFYLYQKNYVVIWEVSYTRKKYYLQRGNLRKIVCRGKDPQKIYDVAKVIMICEND